MKKNTVKISDILKELQEGIDFTIESKKKVVFHNEKIVNILMQRGEANWFYESVKKLFPSISCSYEEKEDKSCVYIFKSKKNEKKDNGREIESQKNKLIEESIGKKQIDKPEGSLNHHFIDDGKGLSFSTEKVSEDKMIKETYHEPRSEAEKNQIIKRNKEKREKENSLAVNPKNKENQEELDKLTSCTSLRSVSQPKSFNSDNNFPVGWVAGGGILLAVGGLTIFIARKNKKKKRS